MHGRTDRGRYEDDLTIKPGVKVELVRPKFQGVTDSLIVRPLPCLDDEDESRYLPYRYSQEAGDITDWIRNYPAAKYVGIGENRYTFLLYDPTDETYEKRNNPYNILYWSIYNAVKKDHTAPHISWNALIEGPRYLPRETTLYFLQGLVFVQGDTLYIGGGKVPKGSRPGDPPQVVQLPLSAGRMLYNLLDEVNEEFDGPEERWEFSMRYGDPVHPKFGRFIRVFPKGKDPAGGEALTDLGGDWADQALAASSARGGWKKDDDSGGGYAVSLDKKLLIKGRETSISAQLNPKLAERLKSTIVWWDEILHIPSDEEQCVIIAKAFRSARSVLEWGWADHPEFFSDEVKKILANAKQSFGAAVPGSEDRDRQHQDLEDWADTALGGSGPGKETGGSVATLAPEDDYGDYDDYGEEVEDEGVEDTEYDETAEAGYEESADDLEYGDDVEETGEYEDVDEYADATEYEEDPVAAEYEYGDDGEDYDDTEYDEGTEASGESESGLDEGGDDEHEDVGSSDEEEGIAFSEDGALDLEGGVTDEEEAMMARAEEQARRRSEAKRKAAKKATKKAPAKKAPAKKATKKAPAKKGGRKKKA